MARDPFLAFLAGVEHAATIDDLAARFKAAGLLTSELAAELIDAGLKAGIRKAVNRDRLPNGLPRLIAVPVREQHELFEYRTHAEFTVLNYVSLWRNAQTRKQRAERVQFSLEREFGQRFPAEKPLKQLALSFDAGGQAGGVA